MHADKEKLSHSKGLFNKAIGTARKGATRQKKGKTYDRERKEHHGPVAMYFQA